VYGILLCCVVLCYIVASQCACCCVYCGIVLVVAQCAVVFVVALPSVHAVVIILQWVNLPSVLLYLLVWYRFVRAVVLFC
jgi:hypothetical protein